VNAVPFTASAALIPPASVQGDTIVSGGGPFTATAQFLAPVVTGTDSSSPDGTVNASPFTANAVFNEPFVWDGEDPVGTKRDQLKDDLSTLGFAVGTISDQALAFLRAEYGDSFTINDYIVLNGGTPPLETKNALQ
jgi:hypothetical protein